MPVLGDLSLPTEATVQDLSEILELSRQALARHIKRAGIAPVRVEGVRKYYTTEDVLAAILKHRSEDKNNLSPTSAREQKIALEVEVLEIKKRRLEGEYIPRAPARDAYLNHFRNLSQSLLLFCSDIADQVAPESDPDACERILKDAMVPLLDDFATDPIDKAHEVGGTGWLFGEMEEVEESDDDDGSAAPG